MYIFVISHLGSGASFIHRSLKEHPRTHQLETDVFLNPVNLLKTKNKRAHIFFNLLNFNYQLASSQFYRFAKFIIVIKEPLTTIPKIKYTETCAINYYCYRLRRLCEIAKKSEFIFVDYSELKYDETYKKITEFLGLKKELKNLWEPSEEEFYQGEYASHLISRHQDYLNYIKRLR